MQEHKTSVNRWKLVVNDYFFPLSEHPEVETEDAAVAFSRGETLAWGYDPFHQVIILTEACYRSHQPAVTCCNKKQTISSQLDQLVSNRPTSTVNGVINIRLGQVNLSER